MILLDTNVVSELIKLLPAAPVLRWWAAVDAEQVWTTAVTVFELERGVALLPDGARKRNLARTVTEFLDVGLQGRIAAVDAAAASVAAALHVARYGAGPTHNLADALIAGIAISRRATLITRNVSDFPELDVPVVDPWSL